MKYEDWIKYERERLQATKKRRTLVISTPPLHSGRNPGRQKPLAPNREALTPPTRRRPLRDLFRSLWGG